MADRSTRPSLSIPFALLGGAAGWLSAGALANPLVDVAYGGKQVPAAICAALVNALVGALLPRVWARSESRARLRMVYLAVPVFAGGALTGALVGRITGLSSYGATSGALNGLISAAAFLPACALVVAAASRAGRARLGSVVAASDRRAVWQILACALAVATLAALPDWPAFREGAVPEPVIALALAVGAAVGIYAVMLADVRALFRVARETCAAVEARSPEDAAEGAEQLDLGLGDEVLARVTRGQAYRAVERPSALIVGSPALASAALARAAGRGVVCLGLAGAVLGAHAWAHGEMAGDIYRAARCVQGDAPSCEPVLLAEELPRVLLPRHSFDAPAPMAPAYAAPARDPMQREEPRIGCGRRLE